MSAHEKTAVLYVRVSTTRQAEDELPIESQISRCSEKAASLGARVDRVFADEGKSGRYDDRQAFQDAIKYCEIAAPTYFITWSTSRFARNQFDAVLYKRRLERAGVQIAYVSLNIDRNSDAGRMTEGVLELFDEFHSRQIAADTIRSMIKNAKDGYFNGGRAPYGYYAVPAPDNPKRKRLAPVPDEAEVVREIFDLRAGGNGAKTIAVLLGERGIKNRNVQWTKSSITALLRNDTMAGRAVFGRRERPSWKSRPRDQWVIVDSHEPIISPDLWDYVQTLMDDAKASTNKGSPKSTYLFTGILHCEKSGTSMQIESGKSCTGKRYWYYNCRAAREGTGESRRIPAREFDQWMLGVILDRILTSELLMGVIRDISDACSTWALEHLRRRQAAAKSLSSVEQKNQKIYELFELYGKDTPNLGDLTKRLRDNNNRIRKLEARLLAIDSEQQPEVEIDENDVADLVGTLRYIIETTKNPKKLRHFLGSFIVKIWVSDDSVRIEYRPECLIVNREPVIVPSKDGWLPGTGSNCRPSG